LRVRLVEVSALAAFFEGHRRAAPLNDLATQSDEQRLNPGPFQASVHWIGEDGLKRFPVPTVHVIMIALSIKNASNR
jgi:hypothetical protein